MNEKRRPVKYKKSGNAKGPLTLEKKIKMSLLIIACVALAALAFSYFTQPPSDACGPDWGTLKVQVSNNYGYPVQGVNVSVWWMSDLIRTGLTDIEGDIAFPHLYFDWYNITVVKQGLELGFLYLQFDSDEHNKKQNFVLAYLNFSLTLNITDYNTGDPISSATVQAYRYNYAEEYQEFSSTTNSSGIAVLGNLEYDEYALTVSCGPYFNYTALVFMDSNKTLSISLWTTQPLPPQDDFEILTLGVGIAIGIICAAIAFWIFSLHKEVHKKATESKYYVEW